jgi:hypothetical protein
MSDDHPAIIWADESPPATLHYPGKLVRCPTLQEALIAWCALADDLKPNASIQVDTPGGDLYRGWEIDRLWRQ